MARNRPLRAPKPRIREGRGPRPPTYRYRDPDRNGSPVFARLQSVDLDVLGLKPGDHILDLGCGTGRHILEAVRRDCHAVGIEPDPSDLRTARIYLYFLGCENGRRARVDLLMAMGERLPFAGESFDRVLCTEVFEHVPDDRLLLNELVRLLRPGGTLAISVPDFLSETISWWLLSVQRIRMEDHLRVYRRRRLVALLREAGLTVYARRYRHSLEALRWFLVWMNVKARDGTLFKTISEACSSFVDERTVEFSRVVGSIDDVANYVIPKSFVVYARKPLSRRAK
jgi:ubiquinone/menaquinone biosynthesis C-methylase UbiE